jgi:hypothetical protein
MRRLVPILFIVTLIMTGCAVSAQPTSVPTTEPAMATTLKVTTSLGEFEVVSARMVDEANSTQANPGEKILLVVLTLDGKTPEMGAIPLDQIQTLTHDSSTDEQVHVTGSDNLDVISTMGGWVDGDFTLGFNIPETATGLVLHWPGQPALDLSGLMK